MLEGIALVADPEFQIIQAAYPFISRKLLTDQSPRLKAALHYMVSPICFVQQTQRLSSFRQSMPSLLRKLLTDKSSRLKPALSYMASPLLHISVLHEQ